MGSDREWIQTFTGRKVWPLNPTVDMICIEDIAHSLSLQCRFTGHTKVFYSVGQHSYLVSKECDSQFALEGLLHDAGEAYLIDLARPVKHHPDMKLFREAERRLQEIIAERFKLKFPFLEDIHRADNVLLMTEKRDLMVPMAWPAGDYPEPREERIVPWGPEEAERTFLTRFLEVSREW